LWPKKLPEIEKFQKFILIQTIQANRKMLALDAERLNSNNWTQIGHKRLVDAGKSGWPSSCEASDWKTHPRHDAVLPSRCRRVRHFLFSRSLQGIFDCEKLLQESGLLVPDVLVSVMFGIGTVWTMRCS
jgi:hypothetical protein